MNEMMDDKSIAMADSYFCRCRTEALVHCNYILSYISSTDDYRFSQVIKVPLPHGSLIVMEGATQEDWQHRVPKEYHDRDPRINLTFRTIFPELDRT